MSFPGDDLTELFNYCKAGMNVEKISELFGVTVDCVIAALAEAVGVTTGKLRRIVVLRQEGKALKEIGELAVVPLLSLQRVFKDAKPTEKARSSGRKRLKLDDETSSLASSTTLSAETSSNITEPENFRGRGRGQTKKTKVGQPFAPLKVEYTPDLACDSTLCDQLNICKSEEGSVGSSVVFKAKVSQQIKAEDDFTGYLEKIYPNGDSYEGHWQNMKRNGQGTLKYVNGRFYRGFWVNNKRHGYGTYVLKSGESYTGWWVDDKKCGSGALTLTTGEVKVGVWNEERIDGYGRELYFSGDSYEGWLTEGQPNGSGTYKWADGRTYTGSFIDSKSNGYGIQIWPSLEVFQKEKWEIENLDEEQVAKMITLSKLAVLHNSGSVKAALRYEGEWANDLMNGQGKFTWDDGKVYVGAYKDDTRHGYGIMTWPLGDSYEGYWANDKFNGFGKHELAKGQMYVGQFKDGLYHGEGQLLTQIGDSYMGHWHMNLRQGKGTYKGADGSLYSGEWRHNLKHGEGVETENDGTQHAGRWTEDMKDGRIVVIRHGLVTEELWQRGRRIDNQSRD